jgi:RNA polymerase sigma-70 factor (ECF subfamily)
MEKSDGELIRAAANGDERAYDGFVRRHTPAALRYCLSRLGDRHAAEDATQEAMVRVFQQVRAGNVPDDPMSWLFSVARNCCNEQARQRHRHQAEPLAGDLAAPAAAAGQPSGLADLLERLADDERGLIQMKHTERLTCREIAERTGKPIGTVTAALSRAYAKLRSDLGPGRLEDERR